MEKSEIALAARTTRQAELFSYLTHPQRRRLQPLLAVLKLPNQEKLCKSLLRYMRDGTHRPINQPVLESFFIYLTRYDEGMDDQQKASLIRPLMGQEVDNNQHNNNLIS